MGNDNSSYCFPHLLVFRAIYHDYLSIVSRIFEGEKKKKSVYYRKCGSSTYQCLLFPSDPSVNPGLLWDANFFICLSVLVVGSEVSLGGVWALSSGRLGAEAPLGGLLLEGVPGLPALF
jgi:hypothetical protein